VQIKLIFLKIIEKLFLKKASCFIYLLRYNKAPFFK